MPTTQQQQQDHGIVRTWFVDNAFGFIRPDRGGPDVFVNLRKVAGGQSLCCGDRVRYELATNPRNGKLEAIDVVSTATREAAVLPVRAKVNLVG